MEYNVMRCARPTILLVAALFAAGCATAGGPAARTSHVQIGTASYYAGEYHGQTTASGATFDARRFTAAHRTLPFGARVRVTNLDNDRSVVVTITDRGPFVHGRIIDVSRVAARELGFLRAGTARVRVEVLSL
jgi:rare lipoprotein A